MRLKKLFLAIGLVVGLVIAVPVVFLTSVWLRDPSVPLPVPAAGTNDASHLSPGTPAEVMAIASEPAAAERQLVGLVQRAARDGSHIAISGAHHTMGGHTTFPGGIVLNMDPFKGMALDEKNRVLTVGAGARWYDIIPFLDHRGYSVAVMQTNNDFSVGGSISANCHGWQNDAPPIGSTVESFRLLKADGTVVRCSRTENRELFSLVLGGYGLFGVILEVDLRVVPNEYLVAEARPVKPADYARVYREVTHGNPDIGLAYGRINVAPWSFLEDGILTVFRRQKTDRPLTDTLLHETPSALKRAVFRGSVESGFGKNLRWWLENMKGETGGRLLSRNEIMNEPSSLYASRDPQRTYILHEYFLPGPRLGEFVAKARPVFLRHRPDLLNITIRNVEPDQDAFMRYATEEVFGLVMLFNQGRDAAAETAMQAFTRELIDVALDCGGHYYLPYRPHATPEQFLRSYPQAPEFFARKRFYDPAGIFQNTFYLNYGVAFSRN